MNTICRIKLLSERRVLRAQAIQEMRDEDGYTVCIYTLLQRQCSIDKVLMEQILGDAEEQGGFS